MTKTFDIVGHRKKFYIISSAIIILSLIFSFIFGVKLAIEFKGGTMLSYSFSGEIDTAKVEEIASANVGQDVSASIGQNYSDKSEYIQLSFASSEGLSADKRDALTQEIQKNFSQNNIKLLASSDIKPSIGKQFFQKCLVAIAFASIILIIYVALRFKKISGWSAGVMAIVALFHDVFVVYATFVFFRIPIDSNFMAVVLTILGFSINDTIVIYDRIRENKKMYGKTMDVAELVNTSINQSLTRSINTSGAAVIVMIVVSIVAAIYGVTSIMSFSFPLIIGLISGSYSTICIAGPLWVDWQKFKEKHKVGYAGKKKKTKNTAKA